MPVDLYLLRAKKNKVEKEMKSLYATRHEMQKLADKGSVADQKNLALVNAGLDRAAAELKELERKMASLGSERA